MPGGIKIDLAELLRRVLDSRVSDIWTNIPGKVHTYTPGPAPVADVIPMIKRPVPSSDDDGEDGVIIYESLDIIPEVPILFPRGTGGTYSITWPLAPGDSVLLMVSTLAIDKWLKSGQLSEPGDLRFHSPGNCQAYPGIGPNTEPLGGAGADPSSIPALVLEGPAIMLGKDATDFVALSSLVKGEFTTLKNAIAAAHCVNGSPLSGFIYSPGDVAALKVKAK